MIKRRSLVWIDYDHHLKLIFCVGWRPFIPTRAPHFYFNPLPIMSEREEAKPPTPLAPNDLQDVVSKTHRKPGAEHFTPGLKRVPMYWHPYRTMAKQRWWGREILELVSTEFRDRSIEYYVSRITRVSRRYSCWQRYALESGVVTVNGVIAKPGTIIKNGDRIE